MKTKTASKKRTVQTTSIPSSKSEGDALEEVFKEISASAAATATEEVVSVSCPYCSEDFEIRVTSVDDGQMKSEQCLVCCRSVSLHIHWEDGELEVDVDRS